MKVYRVQLTHCVYDVPILYRPYLRILGSCLAKLVVLIYGEDALLRPAEESTHPLGHYLLGWYISEVSERYIKLGVLFRLTIFIL